MLVSINDLNNCTSMTSLTPTTLHGICHADSENIHERIKRIVLIPLSLLILTSNGLVLLFIACERKFRRQTFWFATSLGIADMFVGVVSISPVITKANESTLDLCLVRICCTISAIQGSTMFILGIAVDRYIAITRALRYNQIMTARRVAGAIAWLVIQSLLVGFVPLMGWNNPDYHHYCSFLYVLSPGYVAFLFIVGLLPIMVVFMIYIRLYCSARGHIKRIDALEQLGVSRKPSGPFGISARNWKSVKTLLFVIGCLLTTWCPFLIATVVQLIGGEDACVLKEIVGTYLLMLGFSNSFLNPLIYALGSREFRNKFKDAIKRHCCKSNTDIISIK